MPAAQKSEEIQHNQSVTKISTNARIDYVLRFSKHAVLVIDEDNSVCSEVTNQFLAALPDEHNAAYIAISSKLNDIQIRCRIIEQLFANTLFDPEQSLAVSLFNLAKQQGKAISIVAENMHNASVQLLHELTQLALIAKKANLDINVVMSGNLDAGRLTAEHDHLFDKNMSILLAHSGQLVPVTSALFKVKRSIFSAPMAKQVSLLVAIISVISIATIMYLYQLDSASFSQLPAQEERELKTSEQSDFVLPLTPTKESAAQIDNATITEVDDINISSHLTDQPIIAASAQDIYSALLQFSASHENKAIEVASQPANSEEISMAIVNSFVDNSRAEPQLSIPKQRKVIQSELKPTNRSTVNLLTFQGLNPQYYLAAESGFVIQFSGFSKQSILDEFLVANRDIGFHGYHRLIANQSMLMVTSPIFDERNLAVDYLNGLPSHIQNLKPFIKTINTVNSEINSFESSH
ncbi:hypothetical protein [Thalassotalea sp. PLHSN55]|uniref:hypothetical protein n=1 Tax=Thalassotalea sp. PLHSN55 TaxID=3435888 RepID=UPI003F856B63